MDWTKLDRGMAIKDDEYRHAWRTRCQRDGLFLARMLGYKKMLERVHGPVAQMCVQKDPSRPIEEQSIQKEFLHMDPRGVYKTTWSIIDSTQFIICFPDIAICKLTATKPLAKAIAEEIRDHFVCGKTQEKTDFQFLFDEFIITPTEKLTGEYTAPNRKINRKEATVMSFSNETTMSGWHFDVFDPDDIVDTKNSGTPPSIEKVKDNLKINSYTAMPWTYFNYKGTRYNPFDYWGDLLEQKSRGRNIRTIVRSALTLKGGDRLKPGKFPPIEEMSLLFPELLSYEFLKKKFDEGYPAFMTQYMNDAFGGSEVIFPLELIVKATVKAERTPLYGDTTIAWRLPYGDKQTKASGVVGIMDNGRMNIVQAVSGMFSPSNLACEVVKLAKEWGCHTIEIEETPGARYTEPGILNYAIAANWPISITWTEFQEDEGSRKARVKGTEPQINAGRVIFSDEIADMDELKHQLVHFGMIDEMGLADALSRVCGKLPRMIVNQDLEQKYSLDYQLAREREMFDRTHGLGKYSAPSPVEEEKPHKPQPNTYGLEDIMPGLNG